MKKIVGIIIAIMCLFSLQVIVKADTTCSYGQLSFGSDKKWENIYDSDGKIPSIVWNLSFNGVKNPKFNNCGNIAGSNPYKIIVHSKQWKNYYEKQKKCPKYVYFMENWGDDDPSHADYYKYYDSLTKSEQSKISAADHVSYAIVSDEYPTSIQKETSNLYNSEIYKRIDKSFEINKNDDHYSEYKKINKCLFLPDNSSSSNNLGTTKNKSYSCVYSLGGNREITVNINKENGKISFDDELWEENLGYKWSKYTIDYDINSCFVLYKCGGDSDIYFSVMEAPSDKQKNCQQVCDVDDKKCENNICPKYDQYIQEIVKKYEKYNKSCDKKTGCNASELTKANTYINFTRVLCNSILSTRNANDFCVKKCLNMSKDISELKETYGIEKTIGDKCPLGSGLIAFVYNILKWMKYIAPVLVIILGILDFIKALAASDDDAMKKAQKKFIIRLVAAALLFLLPLIIDYVLGVFHLVNENCDINSIFK